MTPTTFADLQPLLDQFEGEGHVLSCYLDACGADGFRHPWMDVLASKADVIRRAIGEKTLVRREFDENVAAVVRAAEAATADSRWLAVFSSKKRGFLETVPLDSPVAPDLAWDRSPYLVPLLIAMQRHREYLAVELDTHRGRLFASAPGAVRLLGEMESEVPRKQHSAGERWGVGQATIARHREDTILHHFKDLADRVGREFTAQPYAGLILLGAHEVAEAFRKELPAGLKAAVKREVPAEWPDRPEQVEIELRNIAADVFAADEARELSGVWDRLAERRAVASGPREVLAALQRGKVGARGHGFLALGPDTREVVGRCRRCRTLALDAPRACPLCQAPCAEGNLWEEVLLMALRHDVAVHFVGDPDRLALYGGMAAILPKP